MRNNNNNKKTSRNNRNDAKQRKQTEVQEIDALIEKTSVPFDSSKIARFADLPISTRSKDGRSFCDIHLSHRNN